MELIGGSPEKQEVYPTVPAISATPETGAGRLRIDSSRRGSQIVAASILHFEK